jgi:hypothetical protein
MFIVLAEVQSAKVMKTQEERRYISTILDVCLR